MHKTYKILIIDDNEEFLSALHDFFKIKKYTVFSAADGLEGLKLIDTAEEDFDLVITDIVMPKISGIGIISLIKNKSPKTPVISITGWGEQPETLAAEFQADRVVKKPVELSQLDQIVVELLSVK